MVARQRWAPALGWALWMVAFLGIIGIHPGEAAPTNQIPTISAAEISADFPIRRDGELVNFSLSGSGVAPNMGTTQTYFRFMWEFTIDRDGTAPDDVPTTAYAELRIGGQVFARVNYNQSSTPADADTANDMFSVATDRIRVDLVFKGEQLYTFLGGTLPSDRAFRNVSVEFFSRITNDASPPSTNSDTDSGTSISIYPTQRARLDTVDRAGTPDEALDTSGGRLNGSWKGGLEVDPVDPAHDDEGTTSSVYTFRLRYREPNGLPPQVFLNDGRDTDQWLPTGSDFGRGVVIYIDNQPHFMREPEGTYSAENFIQGVVFEYIVRPANGTYGVRDGGEVWDNNYVSFGDGTAAVGYHTYYYVVSTDVVVRHPTATPAFTPPANDRWLNNYEDAGSDDGGAAGESDIDTSLGGQFRLWVQPGLRWGGVTMKGTANDEAYDVQQRLKAQGWIFIPTPPYTNWRPLARPGVFPWAYPPVTLLGFTPVWIYEPDRSSAAYYGQPIATTYHSRSRGQPDSIWTFWVNYFSPDNRAPLRVRVWIDGTPYLMTRAPEGGDTDQASDNNGNYADGEWFYFTTPLSPGLHRYMFDADDGVRTVYFPRRPNQPAQVVTANMMSDCRVNNPPQLSNASVTPSSGPVGRTFRYQVTYTDADNDIPRDAFVHIITRPLTEIIAAEGDAVTDTTITDRNKGFDFIKDSLRGGFVEVFDASGNPLFDPNEDDKTDASKIQLPRVTGNTGEVITFSPSLSSLGINAANVRYYRIRYRAQMTTTDTTYNNGAVFTYDFNQFPGPGVYQHYFRFIDNWTVDDGGTPGTDERLTDPESGVYVSLPQGDAEGFPNRFIDGPTVILDNPPVLFVELDDVRDPDNPADRGQDNDISDDGQWDKCISWSTFPANPTAAADITYRVVYYDKDNDPPAYVRVVIDGREYNMAPLDPNDRTYTDGAVYVFTTRLAPGQHNFRFYASDGVLGNLYPDPPAGFLPVNFTDLYPPGQAATFTPQVNLPTVEVNSPPVLVTDRASSPLNVTAGAGTATLTVDRRFANDSLRGMTVEALAGPDAGQTRTVQSNTGQDITLSAALNATRLQVKDATTPALSPATGGTTTVFTFRARYFDANNQPPSAALGGYARVFIDGVAFAMSQADPSDTNYQDGATFLYSTTLAKGIHTFYFEFSDGESVVRLPSDPNQFFQTPDINFLPTLSNASISPSTGSIVTTFTWRITYTDGDNDAPTLAGSSTGVQIVIDGIAFDMQKVNPADNRYDDGADYTFQRQLSVGSHTYYFQSSDGRAAVRYPAAPPDLTVVVNPNTAPELNNPKVAPAKGFPSSHVTPTTFTYEVIYRDVDANPPAYVRVSISADGGRTFQTFAMTTSDPNPNYGSGVRYTYSTTLAAGMDYLFRFETSDGDKTTTTSDLSGPIVNTPPTLSLGQVAPNVGTTQTTFTWSVTYTDADNNNPYAAGRGGFVRVHVFDASGNEISGSPFNMVQQTPADVTYTDGAIFVHSQQLSALGQYTFYFEASDGADTARYPSTGTLPGPSVAGTLPPTLSNGSVAPLTGTRDITYVYRVTYADQDNDAPILAGSATGVQVVIDGNPFDMGKVDPTDNVYTDGVLYEFRKQFSKGEVGPHTFYFQASDGITIVRLPAQGEFTGPTVQNQVPVLSNASLSPASGLPITTFTWQVTYSDADNDAPDFIKIYIYEDTDNDGTINPAQDTAFPYDMQKVDPADNIYTDGVLYRFQATVQRRGPHAYYFLASDGIDTVRLPTSGEFNGPQVNYAPTLANGQVAPGRGRTTTVFTFTVTYSDRDNEPGQPVRLFIYNDTDNDGQIDPAKDGVTGYTMAQQDPNDTNYVDGAVYEFRISGLPMGPHAFFFTATDGKELVRLPAPTDTPTEFPGPTVNFPPQLSNGQVVSSDAPLNKSTSTYTFRVTYTDLNNDPPSSIQVVIAGADNRTAGLAADPNDPDFNDPSRYRKGLDYIFSTTLSPGAHTFYFTASDGMDSTRLPATGTLSGPQVNFPPVLQNAGVQPPSGTSATPFTYTVTFSDGDDVPPASVTLVLDEGLRHPVTNALYEQRIPMNTTATSGWAQGVTYQAQVVGLLSGLPHTFRIEADDGIETTTTTSRPGPMVNNPPTLRLAEADGSSGDGVTPNEGTAATQFTFAVLFQDADNLPPKDIRVFVDDPNEAGSGIPMATSVPNPDYTQGVLYTATMTLSPGQHTFHFRASDWLDATVSTAEANLPYVHQPPTLSNGQVISSDAPLNKSTSLYTFRVTYTDVDGDLPATIQVVIGGADAITGNMTEVDPNDTNVRDGKLYQFSTNLSSGAHTFFFRTTDTFGESAQTAAQSGPQVNFPPVLSNGSWTSASGRNRSDDDYTFTVTYTDADNQPPASIVAVLTGPTNLTLPLSQVDANDTDYTNGALFTGTTRLGSGAYTLQFQASDGIENAAPLTVTPGPQVNFPPELRNARVLSSSGQNKSTDSYTYEVLYVDQDNVGPSSPVLLFIDDPNEQGPGIPMTKDPADDTFNDGVKYTHAVSSLPSGQHRFHIKATNSAGEQAITPEIPGPYVNTPPSLSGASVVSTSGNNLSTDRYTYRVTYTDLDNDLPASITLTIGGADNLSLAMVPENPNDTNATDGILYKAEVSLSGGAHTFAITASDGKEEATLQGSGPQVNFPPVLTNPAVQPVTGTEATTYRFSVTYRDGDNTPPANVLLFVDDPNEQRPGIPMTTTGTDFAAGVVYEVTQTLTGGSHSFHIRANDGKETTRTAEIPQPTVNQPPELLGGTVAPASGTVETEFVFQVTYRDKDGNPPRYVKVFVDDPNETGEGVQMGTAEASPNYAQGVLYTAKMRLSGGTHTFHFKADDRVEARRTSEQTGPRVNNAPTLTNVSVTPTVGAPGSTFTFRVTYTDLDGEAPDANGVRLFIDDPAERSAPRRMSLTTASPDYVAGVVYAYTTQPNELTPGVHTFHITVSDGRSTVRTPEVTDQPKVNHTPALENPQVTPEVGGEGTVFTFSVLYRDRDNVAPQRVLLFVDDPNEQTAGVPMVAPEGATNFADGVVFSVSQSLPPGAHTFHIQANDGVETVRTAEMAKPKVNRKPSLSEGSVSPLQGSENVAFTFRVTYTDADNDPPAFVKVLVDNVGYAMSPLDVGDTTYTDGALFQVSLTLPAGTHRFQFQASDGVETVTTAPQDGPTVGAAPELREGTVTPTSGDTNTEFTFRVVYLAKDNRPPDRVELILDGQRRTMQPEDPNDTTYTDGATYALTTTLSAGSHLFHFEAITVLGVARFPATGTLSGPTVAQGATLVLNVPESIPLGAPLNISGSLLPVTQQPLLLTLTPPEGSALEVSLASDRNGNFSHTFIPTMSGSWQVKVSWAGNAQYNAVAKARPVPVQPAEQVYAPGLYLLTVPVSLKNPDPSVLFGLPTGFRIARWLPEANQYAILSRAELPNFAPGLGFWVDFRQAGQSVRARAEGSIVNQSASFSVTLKPGWNMVGNPFFKTIDWAAARVKVGSETVALEEAARRGWTSSAAWVYREGNYLLVHGSAFNAERGIRPWEGFWIRAFVEAELVLNPVEVTAGVRTRTRQVAPGGWSLALVATTEEAQDAFNYLGVTPEAANGDEIYRLESPPMLAPFVDLRFIQRDGRATTTDLRPALQPRTIWEVEVLTDRPEQEVFLTWPDLSQAPVDVQLVLVDEESGRSVYMRTQSHYTFRTNAQGVRRLRILAEPRREIRPVPTGLKVEATRGGATIAFDLPVSGKVTVEILTLGGRRVRTVAKDALKPQGRAILAWDGTDESGRPLPPGQYLCRVTVSTEEGQVGHGVTTFRQR